MIGNAKGEMTMQANGETYRLHLGMSVIADLQEQFGERLDAILTPPSDPEKAGGLPDLAVIQAVFLGALKRHHADVADRWLVDDIIDQNEGAWARLLNGSAPVPEGGADGKRVGKKKPAG